MMCIALCVGLTLFLGSSPKATAEVDAGDAPRTPYANHQSRNHRSADATLKEFLFRVRGYIALRNEVASAMVASWHGDEWRRRVEFRAALRDRRALTQEGEFITDKAARLLRVLIAEAATAEGYAWVPLHDQDNRIFESRVYINDPFPRNVSHYVSPRLLGRLPNLPPPVEYRIVEDDLLLYDTHADLVVDILRKAFSTAAA